MILSCEAADGTKLEFELQNMTRIGRASDNDIQLFEDSASEHHCEIHIEEGIATVRALGSSSGVLLNGEPVQEAVLHAGSVLRIGETRFLFEGDPGAANMETVFESESADPADLQQRELCHNHREARADWRCAKCGRFFCGNCAVHGHRFGTPKIKFCPVCSGRLDDLKAERAAREQEAVARHPLDPWKYPFRGEGLILLIGGTAFLAITTILQRFAMLLGVFISLFVTGYLLAYSQKIIAATANAEHEPPSWPDFSDFTHDILEPFLQAVALFVLYGLPAFLARKFLPEGTAASAFVPLTLFLIGLLLAPMAWLGMSLQNTIAALSPHFVLPSILRVPAAYLGVVLQLLILVGVSAGLSWVLDQAPVPFLPGLLQSFAGLYFLMVISRLLGLLYYKHRAQLAWF